MNKASRNISHTSFWGHVFIHSGVNSQITENVLLTFQETPQLLSKGVATFYILTGNVHKFKSLLIDNQLLSAITAGGLTCLGLPSDRHFWASSPGLSGRHRPSSAATLCTSFVHSSLFVFLLLNYSNSLYILGKSPFLDLWALKYHQHFCNRLLLAFLFSWRCFFGEQKFQILGSPAHQFSSSVVSALVSCAKKCCLPLRCRDIIFCFLPEALRGFCFFSMLQLKLSFVDGMRQGSSLISLHLNNQ